MLTHISRLKTCNIIGLTLSLHLSLVTREAFNKQTTFRKKYRKFWRTTLSCTRESILLRKHYREVSIQWHFVPTTTKIYRIFSDYKKSEESMKWMIEREKMQLEDNEKLNNISLWVFELIFRSYYTQKRIEIICSESFSFSSMRLILSLHFSIIFENFYRKMMMKSLLLPLVECCISYSWHHIQFYHVNILRKWEATELFLQKIWCHDRKKLYAKHMIYLLKLDTIFAM